METDSFAWLQEWFRSHCNRDWEHGSGILLGTLDNPGWFLTVNLQDTELENKEFPPIEIERSQDNWIYCAIENGNFEGRCGSINLPELIEKFHKWADFNKKSL